MKPDPLSVANPPDGLASIRSMTASSHGYPITVAEAGKRDARKRWGPTPVRPYIGDLPDAERELIMAAIEAERRKLSRDREAPDEAA
jgi:hypothetical protein